VKQVKDYMASPVYVMERIEPIQRARNLMFKYDLGRIPVMDKGKLVGIVTKYDISNRLSQAAPEWRRRPIDLIPIHLVMTENPVTIYPEATLAQAAELMDENEVSGIPVEKDGQMVGMVSSRDLLKFFSEQQDFKAKVGDLMSEGIISVHRHNTVTHVIDEMNLQGVGRAVVYEDNRTPVGIITRSGLTFSKMMGPSDELEAKEIKMTRKESPAGRKQYRYIKMVPLVAEDIMTSPISTVGIDTRAVEAAKGMVERHIAGMPVTRDGDMVGYFSTSEVTKEIARWR
jgi:CBS domain-containing protein